MKNNIILNLSGAVKSLGRNEITSSAVNANPILVSLDNAVNSKSVTSNDAPDKINSAVDFNNSKRFASLIAQNTTQLNLEKLLT